MTFFRKNHFFRFSVSSLLLLATQAHAASACHYIEQANLTLAQGATVNGEVNGTAVNMTLDTGSTQTALLRTAVESMGLTPARTRRQTQGVGGSTSIFTVKLKDFAVGDAHVRNRDFQVVETLENSGAAGIIGNDYLLQYDLELDFAEHRAKLYRAEQCQEKALAYWDPEASAVPMEIMSQSTLPRVKIKINGVALWALIDSGADRSIIEIEAARRLGFSTSAPGVTDGGVAVGIGNEKPKLWNMTFESFEIGDEQVQRPRIAVVESSPNYRGRKEYDMTLGRDFLGAHHVLLAQSQKLFYYSHNGGKVFL